MAWQVYVWSKHNPFIHMSFLGLFTFTAAYLPWVSVLLPCFLNATSARFTLSYFYGDRVSHQSSFLCGYVWMFHDIWNVQFCRLHILICMQGKCRRIGLFLTYWNCVEICRKKLLFPLLCCHFVQVVPDLRCEINEYCNLLIHMIGPLMRNRCSQYTYQKCLYLPKWTVSFRLGGIVKQAITINFCS